MTDQMTDSRWTKQDKISTLKGVTELNAKNKKWIRTQIRLKKAEHQRRIKELSMKTKRMRTILKNTEGGDREELMKVLRLDPDVEMISRRLKTSEILENADQIVFARRKELDRLKAELAKKREILYEKQLDLEKLKDALSVNNQTKSPDASVSEELQSRIENVKKQLEAGLLVQTTYEKMKRILMKDARCFDAVLEELKIDTTNQCKCILKAMELGQAATEDEAYLKEQYGQEARKTEEILENQVRDIKKLKKFIQLATCAQNEVARSGSFKLPSHGEHGVGGGSGNERSALAAKVQQSTATIELIMDRAMVSLPEEAFWRTEEIMKEKYRLLRHYDICNMKLETGKILLNHQKLLLDLTETDDYEFFEHKRVKEQLLKEIETRRASHEKYLKEYRALGQVTIDIRYHLLSMMGLLARITPRLAPIEEDSGGEKSSENEEPDDNVPLSMLNEISNKELESCKVRRSDPRVDPNNMLDIIEMKIQLILLQLDNDLVGRVEQADSEDEYEITIDDEFDESESEEEGKKGGEIDLSRFKIPTRLELKDKSMKLVLSKEMESEYIPDRLSLVGKHDCY